MSLFVLFLIPVVISCPLPNKRTINLSHVINKKIPMWPGLTKFDVTFDTETEPGLFTYQIETLRSTTHVGTHVDAPKHFCPTGWTIDQIPEDFLNGPAVVVDIENKTKCDPDYALTVDDIIQWEKTSKCNITAKSFVLLRTGYGKFWSNTTKYLGQPREDSPELHFPGYSKAVAQWLVEKRDISGLGLDAMSLDPGKELQFPAHTYLLSKNRIGLENLNNLDKLPACGIYLDISPIKIEGASGGPAQVLAYIN